MGIEPGLEGTVERAVDASMTAAAMGSGEVQGLATPALVALLEAAAIVAVAPGLEPGQSTVGTRVEVVHSAPTPVGMKVTARARLDRNEGRRLVFAVEARDEVGEIARGVHERYLVTLSSFEEKIRDRGAA